MNIYIYSHTHTCSLKYSWVPGNPHNERWAFPSYQQLKILPGNEFPSCQWKLYVHDPLSGTHCCKCVNVNTKVESLDKLSIQYLITWQSGVLQWSLGHVSSHNCMCVFSMWMVERWRNCCPTSHVMCRGLHVFVWRVTSLKESSIYTHVNWCTVTWRLRSVIRLSVCLSSGQCCWWCASQSLFVGVLLLTVHFVSFMIILWMKSVVLIQNKMSLNN